MTEETTEKQYWHFSTDPNGDWLAEDGTRYTANAAAYWVTPKGKNVGCPQAENEQEAGAAAGYEYEPLEPEDEAAAEGGDIFPIAGSGSLSDGK